MSTIDAANGTASHGLLGRLLADNTVLRGRLDKLAGQASSGMVGQTYAELGGGAATSLDLRPGIESLRGWQANIDSADMRTQVTQSAMSGIQDIASRFLAKLNDLNGINTAGIDSVAADARAALAQVGELLNSKVGGAYVFAGIDSGNPPVPNPDAITTSGFFTQIQAAVAGLAGNGAAATTAATLAVATDNTAGVSPFSPYLSQPAAALEVPVVHAGQSRDVKIGLLASANTSVASTGAGTGSYMRDVMRALATLGSLSSAQANDPGFSALVQDTRASLTGAIQTMAADVGVLGDTQTALSDIKTTLEDAETALTSRLSAAENVDMARTLSDLSQVQTQLQASYQLIVGLNSLTLTKFLGSA
jgi:flagellar hook-associated protein 3 FlgL